VLYFCTVFVIIFACFTVNATIKAHLSKKYLKKYEENAKKQKSKMRMWCQKQIKILLANIRKSFSIFFSHRIGVALPSLGASKKAAQTRG
jgi:hypothetical protein